MAQNLSAVDLGGLGQTSASQQAAVEQGRSHLQLATSNAEMLSSTWTGQASSQFNNALQQFHTNGTKLLNALQNMHELMSTTQGQFSNAHESTINQAGQAVNATAAAPTGLIGL